MPTKDQNKSKRSQLSEEEVEEITKRVLKRFFDAVRSARTAPTETESRPSTRQ
jgi:hypothetical protein